MTLHEMGTVWTGLQVIAVTWAQGISQICSYALSLRARRLTAEGIHIRQITTTHVPSNVYHFRCSKNCQNLQVTALHIKFYITMGTSCDYGILIRFHDVYLCNAT